MPPLRTVTAGLAAAALAGTLLSGCGQATAEPPTITVTHTVQPQTGDQDRQSAPPAAPSSPGDGSPIAGAAPDGATPHKPTDHRPPTTIVVGRPTLPDPEDPAATPVGEKDPVTTGGKSAGGHAGTGDEPPPGSLSTDGDLIAAATSAAEAAGVAPADPDAPGPQSGPKCPADPKYVDEDTTGLRSDVAAAWHTAVSRAAERGITLCLNDGKRSRAQQQAQFDQYVEQYGREVAEQLVLEPNRSAHVIGIAVDVQPADGYRWLQSTRGSLGFCRIYDNEPWHFEFNPDYRGTGCPDRLPEPER